MRGKKKNQKCTTTTYKLCLDYVVFPRSSYRMPQACKVPESRLPCKVYKIWTIFSVLFFWGVIKLCLTKGLENQTSVEQIRVPARQKCFDAAPQAF